MLSYKYSSALILGALLVGCADEPEKQETVGELISSPFSIKEGETFSLMLPANGSLLELGDPNTKASLIKTGNAYELTHPAIWFDGADYHINKTAVSLRETHNGKVTLHQLNLDVQDMKEKPAINVLSDMSTPKTVSIVKGKKGNYAIKAVQGRQFSVPVSILEKDADGVELSMSGNWTDVQITPLQDNIYTLTFLLPQREGKYQYDLLATDHDGSTSVSFHYSPVIMPEIRIDGLEGATLKMGQSYPFTYNRSFDGQPEDIKVSFVGTDQKPLGNKLWGSSEVDMLRSSITLQVGSVMKEVKQALVKVEVKKGGQTFIDYYLINLSK